MHHYAASLREYGVTANAIAPALIETDMKAGMASPAAKLPMRRLSRTDEAARVARMLLDCGFMTARRSM